MIKKLLSAVRKYNMFSNGGEVLVALSGGADSVALLCGLNEVKDILNIELKAIHINHNIRFKEADRDQIFCQELCKKMNIPIIVESPDIPQIAKKNGESIELAARKIRYDFFNKHCEKYIATAHTADDNAETVLYNLTRGSGTRGFCGIPAVRGNILRPLIFCTREDIIEYLSSINQSFVTDSTNLEDDYTRNKIRHNVVSFLKDINPSFCDSVTRASLIAKEDIEYIEKSADRCFDASYFEKNGVGYLKDDLKNQPPSIRKRVLSKFYDISLKEELDYIHLVEMDKVILGEIKKTSLKNDYLFKKNKIGYLIEKGIQKDVFLKEFDIFSEEEIPNSKFYIKRLNKENFENIQKVNKLFYKFSIDCDKIMGTLKIRSREDGDKFRPVGRKVSKTIKKLLCESTYSDYEKSKLFIISDEQGIIYTSLFGIDERVCVDENSQNIVLISDLEGKINEYV